MSRSQRVRSCWLGSVPYRQAWDLQRALVEQVRADEPGTVLFLEHPHVYTMGRKGTPESLVWDEAERQRRGVELVWSDRGGDATYHGPGQLVAYPILDLAAVGLDLLVYLRSLEEGLISYLASLGIAAVAVPGLTGAWVGEEKLAAIGVKFNGGVVSHGLALNLTTDLDYFSGIVPCGLHDKTATSVEQLTGRRIGVEEAAHGLAPHLEKALGVPFDWSVSLPLPVGA